jgi:hypothetical protein
VCVRITLPARRVIATRQPLSTFEMSRDWTFSSLPWPHRAEPREPKSNQATAWLAGMGCACAGTLFRPEELACCMCFWNDTKTGNRPFVSRGPGMLMGVAGTCRNKARACGIAILLGLGGLWCCYCCCCIFRSGDTGGNSQGMAGMDGRSQTTPTTEHARKKVLAGARIVVA